MARKPGLFGLRQHGTLARKAPPHGLAVYIPLAANGREAALLVVCAHGRRPGPQIDRAFAHAIRTGAPLPTNAENAVANMHLIDAIYEAAGLMIRNS